MKYVESPEDYVGWPPAVFLAGGIAGCPDWQTDALEYLQGPWAVLNPRRRNFPIYDPAAGPGQVDWEYRHLKRADVVLFWFPASPSPQPIAMYELGFHAATGKPIAVGADPGYLRHADVHLQLRHIRPELVVHDSLAATCADAVELLVGLPESSGVDR